MKDGFEKRRQQTLRLAIKNLQNLKIIDPRMMADGLWAEGTKKMFHLMPAKFKSTASDFHFKGSDLNLEPLKWTIFLEKPLKQPVLRDYEIKEAQ